MTPVTSVQSRIKLGTAYQSLRPSMATKERVACCPTSLASDYLGVHVLMKATLVPNTQMAPLLVDRHPRLIFLKRR